MAYSSISWEQSSSGNPIIQDGYGQVICTVFKNRYGAWRVVVNLESTYGGVQSHFSDLHFATVSEAKEHAEQLLEIRHTLKPTPKGQNTEGVSEWRELAKKVNGAPTYGRRLGRKQASVRRAASGQWYYVMSVGSATSAPMGWFATAQGAMTACDAKHLPC
jgi:hypothetical protein